MPSAGQAAQAVVRCSQRSSSSGDIFWPEPRRNCQRPRSPPSSCPAAVRVHRADRLPFAAATARAVDGRKRLWPARTDKPSRRAARSKRVGAVCLAVPFGLPN